jgi:predicted short-subunit dehydrogenase-like oxidoreductase (DUF2520 family)
VVQTADSYKISFIGAGNVAWHLAQALEYAGHVVEEVYSRNLIHARQLAANLYNATPTDSFDFSNSKATVFIICVSDDVLAVVNEQLILPEISIAAHTSGTMPIETLSGRQDAGVLYPLQTFSKSKKLDVQRVPFCIEAMNEMTEDVLVALAQSISHTVYLISSAERKILHTAAVFACNFTNHLLAVSKEILDREELEFDLLKPLIEETFYKALAASDPAAVQTGPAIRNDQQVIQSHLDYLAAFPEKQKIYSLLTESIARKRANSDE